MTGVDTQLREDEIVAEWNLDRDHSPEASCVRNLARALATKESETDALVARVAELEQQNDSLYLRLQAEEHARRTDNKFLIEGRQAAEADRDRAVERADRAEKALREARAALRDTGNTERPSKADIARMEPGYRSDYREPSS